VPTAGRASVISQHVVSITAEPARHAASPPQPKSNPESNVPHEATGRIGGIIEADILGGLLRACIDEDQIGMDRGIDRKGNAEEDQPLARWDLQDAASLRGARR